MDNQPQAEKLLEQVSDTIYIIQELLRHKACPDPAEPSNLHFPIPSL
ncbi:MAG: hypothetical protein QY306_07715 [Anaerolineales bacterium]|nr:MAG: hypothetical protein QY306_07715 [Anaerolineales bacterium]